VVDQARCHTMTTPTITTPTPDTSSVPRRAYVVLSATEGRIAEALFERMFPADSNGPGAREIGVVDYVDRALDGHDKPLRASYKAILAAIEAAAGGRGFANLDVAEQDAIVEALAEGRLDAPFDANVQVVLFLQLRAHLQEGLLADPVYGGNRNASGWRLLGHPGVWLENSAEENLATGPVTKGGEIKTLADVIDQLPHDKEEYDLQRRAL